MHYRSSPIALAVKLCLAFGLLGCFILYIQRKNRSVSSFPLLAIACTAINGELMMGERLNKLVDTPYILQAYKGYKSALFDMT